MGASSEKAKELLRVVRTYPHTTLAPPFLLLCVFVGAGLFGYFAFRSFELEGSVGTKDRAQAIASQAAEWWAEQVLQAQEPLALLAALVAQRPAVLLQCFNDSSGFMTQHGIVGNQSLRYELQLLPNGVVQSVRPASGAQSSALGIDVFASSSALAGLARQSVVERRPVTWGPAPLPSLSSSSTNSTGDNSSGMGFVILQPVFVPAAASIAEAAEAAGSTSSGGVVTAAASTHINPLCGPACALNASSMGLQWWGFVAAAVDVGTIATAPASPLLLLEQLGYRYQVLVLGGSGSGSSSGSGSGDIGAAAESALESSSVPPSGDYREGRAALEPGGVRPQRLMLAVRLSPATGWAGDEAHTYAVSMLAVLCCMGFAAASLLFGALVSWRRNKMLLETLLPKAVLKDLRGEDTSVLGAAQMRPTDTPADTLLSVLADLLEGVTPDLRDVVLVRTALQRNWDVYAPFNLRSHIKGANLDADVAQALMQQLMGNDFGGTPYDSGYGNIMCTANGYNGNATGHGMRGYSAAGGGYSASLSGLGQGSGGPTRRISGFVPYNLDTMAGALQFILSSDASFPDSAPSGALLGPPHLPGASPNSTAAAAAGAGGTPPMPGSSLYEAALAIPEGSSVSLAEIGDGGAAAGGGGRCTVSGTLHTIPSGVVATPAGPSWRTQSLPPTAPRAAAALQPAAYTAGGGGAVAAGAAAAMAALPVLPLKVMNLRGSTDDRTRSQLAASLPLPPPSQLQPSSPQALLAGGQACHSRQLQPPALAAAAAASAVTDSAYLSPTALYNSTVGATGASSVATGPTASGGRSHASLLLRMSSSGSLMRGLRRPPSQQQPQQRNLSQPHSLAQAQASQQQAPVPLPALPLPLALGSLPAVLVTQAIYRSYTVSGVPEDAAVCDGAVDSTDEESGLYGPCGAADLMSLAVGGTIGGGGGAIDFGGGYGGTSGAAEAAHLGANPRFTRTTEAALMPPNHHHYHHHHSHQHAQHTQHRPGSMTLTSTGTGSLLLTVRATHDAAGAAGGGTSTPRPDRRSSANSRQRRPPGRAASFGLPDSPTQLISSSVAEGVGTAASRVQLYARGGRRSVELTSFTHTGGSSAADLGLVGGGAGVAGAAGGGGDAGKAEDSAPLQSYALALLHKPASRLGMLRHPQQQAAAPGAAASPQPGATQQQPQLRREQSTALTVAGTAAAAAVAAAAATSGAGSPSLAQLAQAQHAQHALTRQRKAASHDRLSSGSLLHRLDLSPFLTADAGAAADGAAAAAAGSNGASAIAPSQLLLASPQPLASQTLPLQPPVPCMLEVERLLAKSGSWEFDTWALQEATQGHALSVLGFYLLRQAGLLDRFKLKPVKVARLLRAIENGYLDNPYHSAIHAADVLQTLHVIIHSAQLHVHYLDALGLLASYYAAIVHDFAHPGLTGDFLIATSDPLAIRYNDRSPLENHHCAASFGLLRRRELDALAPLSQSERSSFRKQVIELVLATDMKQHFSILSHFNTVHRLAAYSQQAASPHAQQQPSPKVSSPMAVSGKGGTHKPGQLQSHASVEESLVVLQLAEGEGGLLAQADAAASAAAAGVPPPRPVDDTERLLSLQIALKCADIGHLGESLGVHKKWLANLEEEFFRQGDKERELGIPISPLFDRNKQGVSKSQVGFYDFVGLPLVHALSSAFPGSKPLMSWLRADFFA
ncbi:hypothetical protein HYH02_007480 [Chlamydomonas schloesseri]|uniref:Phosphodiesterase n=1 Tax=Chlamydomonas schloesseri TaxID=2026947 RepID=A0A835WI29_9CHLO|nr:hypothetical protein HYH02_007480 [Chlamydomonas schloesseri]|eukprot:KAG2447556.1 hypothetical protein HYH02_007480 [Chlamydomonas schloesseri]